MTPRRTLLCLLVATLSACEDATTDPLARLVAEETSAALALGVELPDPGAWQLPAGATPEQADAVARWLSSWDAPRAEALEKRRPLYGALAELFADDLGRGGVSEEVDRLFQAVQRAKALPAEELPDDIEHGIDEAVREHALAASALRSDDPPRALQHVLRGSDALREVGPEAVARTLLSEVEDKVGRLSADDPYSEKDIERLNRLLNGGREAVRERDWVLAIRRAYYARGLLAQADPGGDPS